MGIQVEFNPDLALRKLGTLGRHPHECLPLIIEKEREYNFKKEGQRNYWLKGIIPLCETTGNGNLSDPIAAIQIERVEHRIEGSMVYTFGDYRIIEVCKPKIIYFNGMTYLPGGIKIK